MPVNPKFLAARAAERRHRDLAHIRAPAWLPLDCRGSGIVRTPLVPITLRHRIELRQKRNAFFVRAPVLRGDIFIFLWRLHPLYRAPRFHRPPSRSKFTRLRAIFECLLLPLAVNLGSLRSALAHQRLTRQVRRCSLSAAIESIGDFIDISRQDEASEESNDDEKRAARRYSPVAPEPCGADNLANYLMTSYGMSHDEALDFPIALGNQLYRERILRQPDGELSVFAPSDALLRNE